MKLTEKALELFRKWYGEQDFPLLHENQKSISFYDLPKSMQWGVYQSFADSVALPIEAFEMDGTSFFDWAIDGRSGRSVYATRQEARDAALEKLNEILNKT